MECSNKSVFPSRSLSLEILKQMWGNYCIFLNVGPLSKSQVRAALPPFTPTWHHHVQPGSPLHILLQYRHTAAGNWLTDDS